jgi:hypothetical protein
MITRLTAATSLTLLLACGNVWAQDAGTVDGNDVLNSDQPASSPKQASEQETADAAPQRDPSDYQSSEQISEDLSVSFPVDI